MSQVHQCKDNDDAVTLSPPYGMYLKPISRINITIHFPSLKQSLPAGGKSVSSWDIMERLKALVLPDTFISIKVVKNTLEFIRFEGDLENKMSLKSVVGRLEGRKLKVTGIKEPLKILAAETKIPFPSKYDWDSFFRDAKQMNEMKSGERPDTIHFQNLPTEWFCKKGSKLPSENIFKRIWSTFGEIRCIDIPMLDSYRHKMKPSIAGVKTFTFNHDMAFEAYLQYKEYLSFVKAMDALRKTFLLLKKDDKCWVASIKVDFDRSKHLSEDSIRKREIEAERLSSMEKKVGVESKPSSKDGAKSTNQESNAGSDGLDKDDIEQKIAEEERKYLIARRKLEAIRVMDFVFERLKKTLKQDAAVAGTIKEPATERQTNSSQGSLTTNSAVQVKLKSTERQKNSSQDSLTASSGSKIKRKSTEQQKNSSQDSLTARSGSTIKPKSKERQQISSQDSLKARSGSKIKRKSTEQHKNSNSSQDSLTISSGSKIKLKSKEREKNSGQTSLTTSSGLQVKLKSNNLDLSDTKTGREDLSTRPRKIHRSSYVELPQPKVPIPPNTNSLGPELDHAYEKYFKSITR